jgi:hypothetical protein
VTRRRVLSDIGEVQIQRDQNSIFVQTNVKDRRVRVAGEALFVDGLGVVAGVQACRSSTCASRGRFSSTLNRVPIHG